MACLLNRRMRRALARITGRPRWMGDAGCTRTPSFVAVSIWRESFGGGNEWRNRKRAANLTCHSLFTIRYMFDQRHRSGRRTNFALVNDVSEHFLRHRLASGGPHARQIRRPFSPRPNPPAAPPPPYFLCLGVGSDPGPFPP